MTTLHDPQLWFTITEPAPGVFALAELQQDDQVRSYLVAGSERAVLIDTGTGIADIRAVAEQLTNKPFSVITSHCHWDHIGGNWQFEEIAIHPLEVPYLDEPSNTLSLREAAMPEHLLGPLPAGVDREKLEIRPSAPTSLLHGGEVIDLGGVALEVLHLPGHSPGLLAFLDRERSILISTDVVYPGPLYAFGEDANLPDYLRSLEQLAELAPTLQLILPAHDGDRLDPRLIPVMRDAMAAVIDGRAPEQVDAEKGTHVFDGFAIYAPVAVAS
jgi:glyoxylase-like metal-dependent hydrolase (beta-lactamase superfamily II)